jgi:arylformamidase
VKGFDMPCDLEAEYNNRARVPEHPTILARWAAEAQAFRASATNARLGLPYGRHERHRFDLFLPSTGEPTATAMFIHGGYWQSLDRTSFSWIAQHFTATGLAVAIPSYRLAPDVRIADIIDDVRRATVAIWRETKRRPVIAGHSAGGHLAAAMLATDFTPFDAPSDLARRAYAISGVFEVWPLVTTSIGRALQETDASARLVSPRMWAAPSGDRWLAAAVGARESGEFIRQSVDMAAAWGAVGVTTEAILVPEADHFTVLDDLARPTSAMVRRIVGMAVETT